MRKFSNENISVKFIFLFFASVILLTNCQNSPVSYQTSFFRETPKKMANKTANLESFKWKNRIILVKENDDKALNRLRDAADEIKERDIIWFVLKENKIETNFDGEKSENFVEFLENEYFKKFDANVFLIGKDGGVKSKGEKLDLKNYFGQIDSMPMRQREMRENE